MITTKITALELYEFTTRFPTRPIAEDKHWDTGEAIITNGWSDTAPLTFVVRAAATSYLTDGHKRIAYLIARGHGDTLIPCQQIFNPQEIIRREPSRG